MKKKILALLLVMAMSISVFAACSQPAPEEAPADTAAPADTETAEEAPSGEEIEISFGNFWTDTSQYYDVMVEAVDNFNADNEGKFEIVVESLPSGETYNTNVTALATANDLQDIVLLKANQTTVYGPEGLIQDMTGFLTDSGIKDEMFDNTLEEHTIDGTIYGLPVSINNYGYILYNEEIFAEAGVTEFPANVEELVEACDKISAAGYTPITLGIKDPLFADSILFSAFVNKYTGPEFIESIVAKDGNVKFTDEDFVKALTDFQMLAQNGVFNENFASITNDERMQLYLTGEAAMFSAGQWENGTIYNSSEELAAVTKAAAWPGPVEGAKAGDSIEQSSVWAMAIGANADETKIPAIEDFIRNYVITDNWAKQTNENGDFASWEAEYDESKLNPVTQQMVALAAEAEPCRNYDGLLPASVQTLYQRGLQELLLGLVTPEDLAQQMQDEYEFAIA